MACIPVKLWSFSCVRMDVSLLLEVFFFFVHGITCTKSIYLFEVRRLTLSLLVFPAANEIPSNPSLVVQEQVTNFCINILLSYRKFCATVSSSGQLILPEALKLLPLYTLGICFLHIDLCLFIGSVYVEIAVIYYVLTQQLIMFYAVELFQQFNACT